MKANILGEKAYTYTSSLLIVDQESFLQVQILTNSQSFQNGITYTLIPFLMQSKHC